ncbi:MAG: glycerophosphodiester phosphodiesterase [Clostridia bacterium]|nr:glycerophosphodiester phosphodiesterase [Clostridia bacterium]
MEWWIILIIVLASIGVAAALGVVVYRALIAPGMRKCGLEKYMTVKFAHRGLHGDGVAENSLSAFRLAKEAGFGIELDVRLSKDGELVVFHDSTLDRVTGVEGKVIDFTAEELKGMKLAGTDDGIPAFSEVLELIDGRVPLLVEIKSDIGESGVTEKLAEVIKDYHGDYIIESFNPLALRTAKKLMPGVPRGILSMKFSEDPSKRGKLLYTLLENLFLNFLMRPDFIAYNKNGHDNQSLRRIRKAYGTPLFAWTVTSREEEAKAISDGFDSVIFEGYIPDKK